MAKYNSKTKDNKCIFCEIAQGKMAPLGNGTFWENKNYMAWVSPFPNTDGFTIVIPKKHFGSDILAMPDEDISKLVLEAKKVSKILMKHYSDVGRVGLLMEGMGVDHAHVKLFPMHGTENLKIGEWKQVVSKNDLFFKEYPGYIISNDGPKADFSKIEELAKKLRLLK